MITSKVLFYFSLLFILGLILEFFVQFSIFLGWTVFFFAVFSAIISLFSKSFKKKKLWMIISLGSLSLILGISRLQIAEFKITNDELRSFKNDQEVILEGVIIDEPIFKEKIQELKVRVGKSIVLVNLSPYENFHYLDKIRFKGKIKIPEEEEDFNYKNYLLKDYIFLVVNFPQEVQYLGKEKENLFSFVYEKILFLKKILKEKIKKAFLPPYSSLLEGIILGDKSNISQELKEKFRITGLSHLLAISGMHIAILTSILSSFFLLLGFWRQTVFYLATIFIFVYVILVGLPSSAIRSAIMGIIYLFGQKIGREAANERMLVLTCAFMLFWNPFLLFYDIGFQLSFLAVLGIIYMAPILRDFIFILSKKFLKKKEEIRMFNNVVNILSITISAQVFTLPLIIYNFGTLSLISLITNLLALPLVPFIMLSSFFFLFISLFFDFLTPLLSFPPYFLLTYLFWIVDFFSKQWAFISFGKISIIWVILAYIFLFIIIRYLYLIKIQRKPF